MTTETVECPGRGGGGDHSWCACFGTCQCNKAYCMYCPATRDLTTDEWEAKYGPRTSSDAVPGGAS